MNSVSKVMQRSLVVLLCAVLSLSLMPIKSAAAPKSDRVIIHIGSPSVWSIGQAHYLLSKMHQDDRGLRTNMPNADALDANAINVTKLQILKTLFDFQAEYNQKLGVENQAALREQDEKLTNRQEAQRRLPAEEKRLDDLRSRIREKEVRLAGLDATDKLSDAARHAGKENETPPTEADVARKVQMAKLKAEIESDKAEETRLSAQVDKTRGEATASVTPSGLADVQFTDRKTAAPGLPDMSAFVKTAIQKTFDNMTQPRQASGNVLDNFIDMQTQIIAKQLTLLRDEAGPHKRIVFLELPSSIYTVAGRADNYVAQVQWKVTEYGSKNAKKERLLSAYIAEDLRRTHEIVPREAVENLKADQETRKLYIKKMGDELAAEMVKMPAQPAEAIATQPAGDKPKDQGSGQKKRPESYERPTLLTRVLAEAERLDTSRVSGNKAYFEDAVKTLNAEDTKWNMAKASNVRAVEIIPHQSALNVNDIQSKTSQVNFFGVLKLLVGFGLKVDYQRQRELYEQYIQQEVFASGFGKGLNAFGWTFGPLPGTNRVAPGVRTTYAVLAVPDDTVSLKLAGCGAAFDRRDDPDYNVNQAAYDRKHIVSNEETFMVDIPGENNEQFFVREMYYTPAKKGEPVTTIIKGDNFSPQLGVLVDGTPLKRAISLGNTGTSDAGEDNTGGGAIHGQFEQVSSNEVAIKFSMGDKYVGTPNITLITPEKSSAVNFMLLKLNGHGETSLRDLSLSEPMFMDDFSLEEKLVGYTEDAAKKYAQAWLRGSGLRRRADVWVGNIQIPYKSLIELSDDLNEYIRENAGDKAALDKLDPNFFQEVSDYLSKHPGSTNFKGLDSFKALDKIQAHTQAYSTDEFTTQVDTGMYFLYFKKREGDKWPIRFRHNAIRGLESKDFTHAIETPTKKTSEILHYTPSLNGAVADLRLYTDAASSRVEINPYDGRLLDRYNETDKQIRVRFFLRPEGDGKYAVERDKFTIRVVQGDKPTILDINLPVRPQVGRVSALRYSTSGGNDFIVTILGDNLQRVTKVFFWDIEAKIVGAPDRGSLTVKVPNAELPGKEEIEVPIMLETSDGLKIPAVVLIKPPPGPMTR